MKNNVYFIVIAFLVGELFKIMIYLLFVTSQSGHKIIGKITKKWNISEYIFCVELKRFTVVMLFTKFFNIAHCDISMATQWAPDPLHSKGKIRVSLFSKCYLLLAWCSFSGCERIWTLHSTSTRKSVRLWSSKEGIFQFGKVEVSWFLFFLCHSGLKILRL